MDIWAIVGIIAAVVGVIAGIVQVVDYLQKQRAQKRAALEKALPAQIEASPGEDIYTTYEASLRELLARLRQDRSRYSEALVYQQQLTENIARSRRHGNTAELQADRSRIIEQLNDLSLAALDTPFSALCRPAGVTGSEPVGGGIPHNLPPRGPFVGRDADKARILEAFGSRSYLVSVEGIGGIGKTSLALEVAHECLEASRRDILPAGTPRFAGFVWTTARDRTLAVDDLLDTIARTLDRPGIAQRATEEKVAAVNKLLQAASYLLIVDNFETITDDRVRDFLVQLPEPSKALLTTREPKLRQAWAVPLEGLSEKESLALVREEGRRLGLAALEQADDRTLAYLHRAAGGAPLALKWAVGQIKQKGQSLDAVLAALHEARGDLFDAMFGRSWSLLAEESRQVLTVMPLFAAPASRAAIEAASDVHHFALDDAIGQLIEMSLVEATGELDAARRRYVIHPLTRAFAVARTKGSPVVHQEAFRRLVGHFQTLTEMYGGFGYHEEFAYLELELPNALAIISECLEGPLFRLGGKILLNIAGFLATRGYWNDLLTLGQRMVERAVEMQDQVLAARWRIYALSWVYRHRGRLDLAEECGRDALEVLEQHGEKGMAAYTRRSLGRIAQERGNYEEAEALLREALAYYQTPGTESEFDQLLITTNLAENALERGALDTAWDLCQGGIAMAHRMDDPERLGQLLDIQAQIVYRRGQPLEAEKAWGEALIPLRRAKRADEIAHVLLSLGRSKLERGEEGEARPMLLEAQEIYRRLDVQSRIQEIESLLPK